MLESSVAAFMQTAYQSEHKSTASPAQAVSGPAPLQAGDMLQQQQSHLQPPVAPERGLHRYWS